MTVPPPRSASAPPPISNIPEQGLPFLGRDEQIASLGELISQYRHVLLHDAESGERFGKTQTAIAYYRTFSYRYQVAWWFHCEGETDDERLVELIEKQYEELRSQCAQTFGMPATTRPDRKWLFVYDGVPDPDRVYEHFVPGAGHRLVTSRTGGHTWGKNRLALEGLSGPVSKSLLMRYSSDSLTTDQTTRLAALTKGHPEALLTAAEGVRRLGYDQYLRLYADPAPGTNTPPHGMPVVIPAARAAHGSPLSSADRRTLIEQLLASPLAHTRDSYELWLESIQLAIKPIQLTPRNDGGKLRERIISIVNFALGQSTSKVLSALADALDELGEHEATADVRRLVDKGVAAWNGDRPR